jgi:hypothetical protein
MIAICASPTVVALYEQTRKTRLFEVMFPGETLGDPPVVA